MVEAAGFGFGGGQLKRRQVKRRQGGCNGNCGGPAACGGRTRIRTRDPLIKSQLLYQLSYTPHSGTGYCIQALA